MKGKEIEGEYYQNTMEPHQHLSNRQIADVLTYIRNSFGNKASAVSEEEVKKLRNIRK
jgi:mono/diheme cytochrome c family protein